MGINPLAVDSELVHYDNPRRCTNLCESWPVGNGHWRVAPWDPAAGMKRNNASMPFTDCINGLRNNAHHQGEPSPRQEGFSVLAIESLNVAGMDKLPHQAKAVRDAAIGGLLQKVRYKADWYGTVIVEADRFFPSSKLCSDCGAHNEDLGRELHWTCPQCGIGHDRNENAALNLLTLAVNAVGDLHGVALGPGGPM